MAAIENCKHGVSLALAMFGPEHTQFYTPQRYPMPFSCGSKRIGEDNVVSFSKSLKYHEPDTEAKIDFQADWYFRAITRFTVHCVVSSSPSMTKKDLSGILSMPRKDLLSKVSMILSAIPQHEFQLYMFD